MSVTIGSTFKVDNGSILTTEHLSLVEGGQNGKGQTTSKPRPKQFCDCEQATPFFQNAEGNSVCGECFLPLN